MTSAIFGVGEGEGPANGPFATMAISDFRGSGMEPGSCVPAVQLPQRQSADGLPGAGSRDLQDGGARPDGGAYAPAVLLGQGSGGRPALGSPEAHPGGRKDVGSARVAEKAFLGGKGAGDSGPPDGD